MPETELHFGHALLGKPEAGRFGRRAQRHAACLLQVALRLGLVRAGHPFGGQRARGGVIPRLPLDRGDHLLQGPGQGRRARFLERPAQQLLRPIHVPAGQQQRGSINALGFRGRFAAIRVLGQRRKQIAAAISRQRTGQGLSGFGA